jgi:hypothetical protein
MVRSKLAGATLILATVMGVQVAGSQTVVGDQAPMFRGVDQNMRLVDMAEYIDGTPLLFLYTSAT